MTKYANGKRPQVGDEISCFFIAKVVSVNSKGEPYVECDRGPGNFPAHMTIRNDETQTTVTVTKRHKTPGQLAYEKFQSTSVLNYDDWANLFPVNKDRWEAIAEAARDAD